MGPFFLFSFLFCLEEAVLAEGAAVGIARPPRNALEDDVATGSEHKVAKLLAHRKLLVLIESGLRQTR